jgi:hypothetical protein
MSLQNVSKVAVALTQRDNPEAAHTRGTDDGKPEEDLVDLLDKSAGLFHVMHKVMGEEKAKDHCRDGDFSTFRACVHNSLCVIQDYTKANPKADNQEVKIYTMLMELYEDFKTLTWDQLNVNLMNEGVAHIGNFDFVSADELKKGCDGFSDFLKDLKGQPAELVESGGEEASEMAAAARVSMSLIEAAKTTHAVLDAHAHNSSADGTVAALHAAWTEPCKLLSCDHTNYWDLLGASYTHSLALLNLGMSAHHMKVHVVTRSRLEKRMQKFLASHGSGFSDRVIRTEGAFTEARMSQYSDALMDAFVATLTGLPQTYGVDSLLLSMADRSAVLEFAKTPFQQNVLEALRNDNVVAYPDADKLREKMNLPPSAVELLDEELGGDEDLENHADDAPRNISNRASLIHLDSLLDRSLQRKGFVKVFENAGKAIVKGYEDTGKAIVNTAVAVGQHIEKTYTAIGEALVTVVEVLGEALEAFADFVVSLVQCFGMGTVVKVGYGKSFPGCDKENPKACTLVSYLALSLSIAIIGPLEAIFQGKLEDIGVAISFGMVVGVCPGFRSLGLRVGFGIGLSLVCNRENGCSLNIAVGAVASAAVPWLSPLCIAGPVLIIFTKEIADCMQSFGVVLKLLCCKINLATGCSDCGSKGGCPGPDGMDGSTASRLDDSQQAAYRENIDSGGASAVGCVETLSGNGAGYRGCQVVTRSGRVCQKWSTQHPHKHGYTTTTADGLGDHNMCRNPNNKNTIWCYTTDKDKEWESCDLRRAAITIGSSKDGPGGAYNPANNKRCTTLHGQKVTCDRDAADPGKRINTDHPGGSGRWEITQEGDKVCARRLDKNLGWSMGMKIVCDVQAIGQAQGSVPNTGSIPSCFFGGKVLITSHRNQNLQDSGGNVKLHGNTGSWEQWTIRDAGQGKVFIRSHRNQNLQDNGGRVTLHGNTGGWEQWTIIDAGQGKVFVRSHRNQNLQDNGGNVKLNGNTGGWEQWKIRNTDGSPKCAQAPPPTPAPPPPLPANPRRRRDRRRRDRRRRDRRRRDRRRVSSNHRRRVNGMRRRRRRR